MDKVWLAASYVRVSRKDGDKIESDSISNQEDLIRNYASARDDIQIAGYYADDDYTGTNFNRPAFQRMMKAIESGAINCVIVKDLSRFGRDYIDVGNYLQKIYPKLGVRFIAITDNIDSAKTAYDMLMPVKNIFNEQYARDISKKVLTTLSVKQQAGQFIGAFASYGYLKDPDKKGHLVVDPYAANIVRRIYSMFLEGKGKMSIARILNSEGILCPSEYKKSIDLKYSNCNKLRSTAYWTYSTVQVILKNEIYTGKMVQHKSNCSRYRAASSIKISEEDWCIVPNTHEAIITEEEWRATQRALQRRTRQMGLTENVSIFAGFLVCKDCGRAMSKISTRGRTRYVCGTYKRYSTELCSSHRIFHEDLEEIILNSINAKIDKVHNICEVIEQKEKQARKQQSGPNAKSADYLKAQISKNELFKKRLYEDYCSDVLTKEEYLQYKEDTQNKIAELNKQLGALSDKKEALMENPWIRALKNEQHITELTRPTIEKFIDKISIGEQNTVYIDYKFGPDYLPEA